MNKPLKYFIILSLIMFSGCTVENMTGTIPDNTPMAKEVMAKPVKTGDEIAQGMVSEAALTAAAPMIIAAEQRGIGMEIEAPPDEPVYIVIIPGIYDGKTGKEIKDARLRFSWEEPDGSKRDEEFSGEWPAIEVVRANGQSMMHIKAEAQGYHPYGIRVRSKILSNKVMKLPVWLFK